jgi:hypothetical protein
MQCLLRHTCTMSALVNGLSPLVHVADMESLYSSRCVSHDDRNPRFLVHPSPNSLINEFLQLSGNLPLNNTNSIPGDFNLPWLYSFFIVERDGRCQLYRSASNCLLRTQYRMIVVQTISRHVIKNSIKPMVTR